MDDASSDSSADVLQGFADPRIRLVRHEHNKGPSAARNTGFAKARGEFIALQLSGNDEKRQAALIKRHGKEWSGPFAKVADDVRFEGAFITSVRLKRMTQARFAVLASAR